MRERGCLSRTHYKLIVVTWNIPLTFCLNSILSALERKKIQTKDAYLVCDTWFREQQHPTNYPWHFQKQLVLIFEPWTWTWTTFLFARNWLRSSKPLLLLFLLLPSLLIATNWMTLLASLWGLIMLQRLFKCSVSISANIIDVDLLKLSNQRAIYFAIGHSICCFLLLFGMFITFNLCNKNETNDLRGSTYRSDFIIKNDSSSLSCVSRILFVYVILLQVYLQSFNNINR